MDAVTALNERIDIEKLLEYYSFDVSNPDGNFVRSSCKIHGGDNPTSFVINLENGLWYCHTGCGGGDAYTLVQKLENVSFTRAVERIAEIFDVDITSLEILERKTQSAKEIKKWMDLMRKQTRKKEIHEYRISEEIREVLKFRDFKEETLRHFGLGYVEQVELSKKDGTPYTLRNRLVFPVRFNNLQVAISFRRVKNSDVPKWSHQPTHIDMGDYLYNFDAVQGKHIIVICEGIVDVWAYHEVGIDAVATFGSHVTSEQYKSLMKTGATLVWSFDGDEAGRNARDKAIALFKHKADQSCVEFAEDEDPASISREELLKRYENKRRC